jgi:hypothetical protein
MRGHIATPTPTYRELLDSSPPHRVDPSDELVAAHLAANSRELRIVLAVSAAFVIVMALAVAWLLG